ncbi:MAG: ribbon-helix-helix protein, CopG family [Rhodocyclaceae bacterium]|nr:ribbon-helix-helix protein, CopG family [Rhodocyclaceae bacterium]
MSATLTVRLSDKEVQSLDMLCEMTGKSRSEVVREALRGQSLRARLDRIRAELQPAAQQIGWLTEEDVFREVS